MRRTYRADIWRNGETVKRVDYSTNKRDLVKAMKERLNEGDLVHVVDCYSNECVAVLK